MKTLKNELIRLAGQIFRNTQYLKQYEHQLALIYSSTPETIKRTRERIDGLKMQIEADSRMVEKLNAQMIATIEALDDWRIQEILTRRYVGHESFEAIAEAMNYDLRWIYRLHQQGLELTNPTGDILLNPAA